MYVPGHFSTDERGRQALAEEVASGELVTGGEAGLLATHVPVLFDPSLGAQGGFLGHLARNNDQWRHPVTGDALLICTGPNGYVSPGWYPSKADGGRVVPTWNYLTVHAYGQIEFFDDVARLETIVTRLTVRHEGQRANPWAVSDAPRDYLDGMLRAIVGFCLTLTRFEAKAKLSQNRPDGDIAGVIDGVQADGNEPLANLMRTWNPKVSGS